MSLKTETHGLVHAHWSRGKSISSHPSAAAMTLFLSSPAGKTYYVLYKDFLDVFLFLYVFAKSLYSIFIIFLNGTVLLFRNSDILITRWITYLGLILGYS